MISPVTFVDLCRIFCIHSCKNSSCHHQPSGDPGRDIIGHIIQLCRNTAEIKIFVIFISKHGIHGIDTLVQKHQRHPADSHIKHGGDHAVGCIFRNGFHGSLCHAGFRKLSGITAYDHGHRIACLVQSSVFQPVINLHTLIFQGTGGKKLIAPENLQHKSGYRQIPVKIIKHQKRHPAAEQTDKHYDQKASCQLTAVIFRKNLPDHLFQHCDQIADDTDRMIKPSGISDQKIQHKSYDQRRKTIFQHLFSASVLSYIPVRSSESVPEPWDFRNNKDAEILPSACLGHGYNPILF